VFIRYLKHSKGYVICGKYPNGGMMEINSSNVDFLKDDFPNISEMQRTIEPYDLQ